MSWFVNFSNRGGITAKHVELLDRLWSLPLGTMVEDDHHLRREARDFLRILLDLASTEPEQPASEEMCEHCADGRVRNECFLPEARKHKVGSLCETESCLNPQDLNHRIDHASSFDQWESIARDAVALLAQPKYPLCPQCSGLRSGVIKTAIAEQPAGEGEAKAEILGYLPVDYSAAQMSKSGGTEPSTTEGEKYTTLTNVEFSEEVGRGIALVTNAKKNSPNRADQSWLWWSYGAELVRRLALLSQAPEQGERK